ncbi:5-(carboxyamino)imidazole ribonucleotide synthase [Moheibacter sediminis]|uniref:N5-carboxyaminoimidazole ribonucleotide synthase n=1 Tax=Moheibacter sediminis TaxID=1434700 RepID=A0A1W1ZS74_9FLAO|nr:5-(carboxyamino)imidazole ribonucleotide synthase [Moheibacter sediminis]SMC51236.1 5-(carboxyamino)imidazole ribonucleotide synthase [Moheibacter sediminis]
MIKIGILGGGQLGYMFLQNAMQYPAEIHILDPSEHAPCAKHAHHFVQGDFVDYQTVIDFGKELDAIGIEIEHVNVEALRHLKSLGKRIVPDPEALAIIQDKSVQKKFYIDNEIPTAPYFELEDWKELICVVTEFPLFQKANKGGYDGKGVQFLPSRNEIEKILRVPSIYETPADLDKEIAVVVIADGKGNFVNYPVVELVFNQEYNLLDYLLMPSSLDLIKAKEAEKIALQVVKALNSPGVFAVEMFLNKDGSIWVNETASRVHNSGHSTIEAAYSSQFDQMLRTLMDLPLGSTNLFSTSAMVNLIGAENESGKAQIENLDEILKIPGVYLHWYAKQETRPGRKMGHITLIGNDLEELKSNIEKVNKTVQVTAER